MLQKAPGIPTGRTDAEGGARSALPPSMLSILKAHRRSVLISGVVAVLLALVILWAASPRYTSTAQIMLFKAAGGERGAVQAPRERAQPVPGELQVQALIAGSDTVLEGAIRSAALLNSLEFNPTLRPPLSALSRTVLNLLGLRKRGQDDALRPQLLTLRALRQRLDVRAVPATRMLNITVRSQDGRAAARIANAVAASYGELLSAEGKSRVGLARKQSEAPLAALRRSVQASESELSVLTDWQREELRPIALATDQQLRDSSEALTRVRKARTDAQRRLDMLRAALVRPESVSAAVRLGSLRDLGRRLRRADARKVQLSERLRARHPDMVAIERQRRRLRGQITRRLRGMIRQAEGRLARLRSEEQDAAAAAQRIAALADAARAHKAAQAKADSRRQFLTKKLAAQQAALAAARAGAAEAVRQAAASVLSARIVTAALPPAARSWPPSALIVLPAALLAGIGLSGCLAVLRGRKQRLRQAAVASPGVAARWKPSRDVARPASRSMVVADFRNISTVADIAPLEGDEACKHAIELATSVVDEPEGDFAQRIERLYDVLQLDLSEQAGTSTLLISGEECTGMASAIGLGLAMAGAAKGRRVLIVDGDARGGRLSRTLLVPVKFGLQDVAHGRCTLAEAVVVDPVSGVEVLAQCNSGSRGDAAADDLELLQKVLPLADGYDQVIIDGAGGAPVAEHCRPALAVDMLLAVMDDKGECGVEPAGKAFTFPVAAANLQGIVLAEPLGTGPLER